MATSLLQAAGGDDADLSYLSLDLLAASLSCTVSLLEMLFDVLMHTYLPEHTQTRPVPLTKTILKACS